MFCRTLLIAASVALIASTPALAQSRSPGFYPGTTAEAKFNWGKKAYQSICGASIPAQLQGVQFDNLFTSVQQQIEALTMDNMIDFIKPYCGNTAVAAGFIN